MFAPVEPVQASAPRMSLVRAAINPNDGARWESGLAWRPERCFGVSTFDPCDVVSGETQTVTITGGPTGGTFTLTYSGQTTGTIAFNAAAATVQAALIALSNLLPGDVTVSGVAGGPYTLVFRRGLGNVTQTTGDGAGLTGGTAPAVVTATTVPGVTVFGTPQGASVDGLSYYLPPALRVEERCTTRTGDTDLGARVRRQAEAATSFAVAHELWTGQRSDANPYTNPEGVTSQVNGRLASVAATIEPGIWDPYDGLGRLEELARREALGQDVFIHVPLEFVPLVANAVERNGNTLQTETGAIIVADAGYLGTTPAGARAAGQLSIYATGPVQVRLSEIVVSEEVDHRLNLRVATADRVFAATFDPCVHHGLVVRTPATS